MEVMPAAYTCWQNLSITVKKGRLRSCRLLHLQAALSERRGRRDEVPYPPLIAGLDTANRAESLRRVKGLLLGIVRAVLSGYISNLAGCSAIAGVAFPLDEPELNVTLRTFEVVAGETDEFPTGETRKLWHPELLKVKDAEATDYENRIRSEVQNACRQLKRYLEAEAK
jgi:hypothetical protein